MDRGPAAAGCAGPAPGGLAPALYRLSGADRPGPEPGDQRGGFTLAHFQLFFARAYFLRSLSNTLGLGVTLTLLVAVLGFALAYLVTRGPRPLRLPLRAVTVAPLVAPPYLFGLALIIIAGRRGFLLQLLGVQIPIYGWPGVIVSQILSLRPVAFLMVTAERTMEMASVISVILLVPSLVIFLAQHYWLRGKTFVTMGGAPVTAEERRIPPWLQAGLWIPCLLYAGAVLASYGVIVLGAFTKLVGIDNRFTLQHLVTDVGCDAIWTSMKVSLSAGAVAALVGTGLAYLCVRGQSRLCGLLEFT
jgi:ABC-type Fe3+ transport system permease subunit